MLQLNVFGKLIYYNYYYLCMYSHTFVYGLLTIYSTPYLSHFTSIFFSFFFFHASKKKKILQYSRFRRCTIAHRIRHSHFIFTTYYPRRNTVPAKGKVKQRSKRSSSRINDARRRCNRVPLTQFARSRWMMVISLGILSILSSMNLARYT